jgi:NAD(P)-dependent dehydrogenase (short-subunit alcohol dehydrogenase family)
MSSQPIILVTGATDGLGKGVASALARAGAEVIVHGRDDQRIANTLAEIRQATPGARVRSVRADFASLADVRELARQLLAQESHIEVLINNAGIGSEVPYGPARRESYDGHELRFAVNYLAPYLLTRLLLPLLTRSAPSRIVNVSSIGQQAIDFADVMLQRDYSGVRAYRQSKLAQVLFTFDLARELEGSGVSVTALHPATYMPTKIVQSPISTLAQGVEATTELAIAPALAGVSGKFFDGVSERRADAQAYERKAQLKLRALSDQLTGLKSG